jgi:hypothetical protein
VQTAWGILSNPELRSKYEAGGLEAINEAALKEHGLQVLLFSFSTFCTRLALRQHSILLPLYLNGCTTAKHYTLKIYTMIMQP